MPRLSARLSAGQRNSVFANYYRFATQRLENAALIATDQARTIALSNIRQAMAGAGLGRLGDALKSASDKKRGVHRYGTDGFSASGIIFIRSKSERTVGAIQAYTEGAEIRPVRGRYLWIATDEIPARAGRYRMTPELYRSQGFETKIGPLVLVKSVNGLPLLVAKNISVGIGGTSGRAKSLTKKGLLRKGQRAKQFVVCFIGIPRTSRAARVDARAIIQSVQDQLPQLVAQAIGRI